MNNKPRMLGKIFTAVFLLFAAPTTAEIKSMKIRSDKRPKIVFENFGFTYTGYVSVEVTSATVTSPLSQPDPSRLGFFIFPKESRRLIDLEENPDFCLLDSKLVSVLFTFQDISPPPQAKLYPVTYPGEYLLQFANCNPHSVVTMDVRTEFYNNDVGTGTRDYLSTGQTQLPKLYLIFAFIYVCFLGLWVVLCFKARDQPYFHKIHLLMSALLVAAVLNLLCAAADRGYVKVTGTPHGWNVLFYIFQFFRSVLLYLVMVLIGAGWSFLKPLQLASDKPILIILFALEALANVASVMIKETGPSDENWETWILVYFVAESMCFVATCIPILCTIDWLRKVSMADEKAASTLPDGLLFAQYGIPVTLYLYCKIWFWNTKMSGEKEYWWVYNTGTNSAAEILNLVFYIVIFYMLRPVEKTKYFVVDVEQELEVLESVPEKNEHWCILP